MGIGLRLTGEPVSRLLGGGLAASKTLAPLAGSSATSLLGVGVDCADVDVPSFTCRMSLSVEGGAGLFLSAIVVYGAGEITYRQRTNAYAAPSLWYHTP